MASAHFSSIWRDLLRLLFQSCHFFPLLPSLFSLSPFFPSFHSFHTHTLSLFLFSLFSPFSLFALTLSPFHPTSSMQPLTNTSYCKAPYPWLARTIVTLFSLSFLSCYFFPLFSSLLFHIPFFPSFHAFPHFSLSSSSYHFHPIPALDQYQQLQGSVPLARRNNRRFKADTLCAMGRMLHKAGRQTEAEHTLKEAVEEGKQVYDTQSAHMAGQCLCFIHVLQDNM